MTTDDRKQDLIEQAALTSVKKGAKSDAEAVRNYREAVRHAEIHFAVFEAAQRPTDDEREALTLIVRDVHNYDGRPGYLALHGADAARIADAILAAGFRRPAQSEPSCMTVPLREGNNTVNPNQISDAVEGENR